ncbi:MULTISPECIES: sulfite exporter TauE/SafE family protein [unclassified Ruegeria]|uniref:sulfite exporter TauE/SafE family protein n=2 Tax=unclassified Ruegeria TaxID=2625375 RepID=UPI001487F301|nr:MULTISPECIES: sulfite exporter TauE/SafE family protein [unclassified Ruegeria]NOD78123.1 TSUP family transporter [Ruegeria sp. HKCCD4332]NOD90757.1 TSUP family transporter [Ruegeria sp. HKCCD4318]NOE15740.1 TSUP family transporter [Ruegeria sp. HKCCD4318-2]NOG07987.1 sulfite exporter TauE/SafE family protein [Ruegeria sp. HKCCD4315]
MSLFSILSPQDLMLAMAVAFAAGWIKGIVGFAMPMVMVSGLNSFLTPELTLAGLILPTLVTNGLQALRGGATAAYSSILRFRVFLIVGGLMLVLSAQLVTMIPSSVSLLLIGGLVSVFCLFQVLGVRLVLNQPSARIEAAMGGVAGFAGGMSGVWGPPTVAYLMALNTPKKEQIRIQGVIYGLGAVLLLAAHLGSGILRAETLPFSAILILPALVGMWVGIRLQDRIDQASFRKATLFVLLVAGLNLLRRGLMG